jgi:hypothetical protein
MEKDFKKTNKSSEEVQHAENPDETSVSILFLDENEDEEVISPKDVDDSMGKFSDMVDQHLDDFIQVGRRRWDVSCFIFYRDPIYDIEGGSHAKEVELSSSENCSPCAYNSDSWQPNDDMVTDLFHPFVDDLSQYTHDDSQPFLESCDEYPFGDLDLFYEDFLPP